MNKMLTSVIALGAGMAVYNYAQKNNMISNRKIKNMQKRITKVFS
ncbi:YrzQ family protein [Bacillus methanolicus]|nr:YrzQ family protein [Bacillus methanolicus]EIJ83608.1 hypothetical protein MGA3_10330 [Bacillus methanolicus MGA3]UQD52848.1 DUF3918 domain-containing protein [Bacillus methanolicus]